MDLDGLGLTLSTAAFKLAAVVSRVLLPRDDCLLSVMSYYKVSRQALAVHYTLVK